MARVNTLKLGLEKPNFIWLLITIIYSAVFWGGDRVHAPAAPAEQANYEVARLFAESSFPPRIGLIRELPDLGHLSFHALMGRAYHASLRKGTAGRPAPLYRLAVGEFVKA